MKNVKILFLLMSLTVSLNSCRTDAEDIIPSQGENITGGTDKSAIKGFFLLNEGNMGSNKASLDYFDYSTGIYHRNIYAERNPDVVQELGDMGNDLQVYGNKLYAVINGSNLIEVMDLETMRHITQISIPGCRYITFSGEYAYVTSYAGPVQTDPNARLGYVARVDTATLAVEDTCVVGYQPEEMVVVDDKLYVANSGGLYTDRTVSVIDLNLFSVMKTIDVAVNLHRMAVDSRGYIYVTSRGNYYDVPSHTFIIDSHTDQLVERIDSLPVSDMALCGDSLYIYSNEWNYLAGGYSVSYAIYNTLTRNVVTRNFITDGTDKYIRTPYGIAVNPDTREFLITDAGDYVTPGTLHCYSPQGTLKWSVTTGDIPAHIAFTTRNLAWSQHMP